MSVSSTNKTDSHDITEIVLKVALNTIIHKLINYVWFVIASFALLNSFLTLVVSELLLSIIVMKLQY
jgi:hypothetical protein